MKNNLDDELNQRIVKIVIHTSSGYWEPHYSDKLSITADSIKYEYHEFPSPEPIKWSYSTNDKKFQQQFEDISNSSFPLK